MAEALLAKASGKEYSYQGEEGVCPDCHGNMIEKISDGWYRPQCQTKAVLAYIMENFRWSSLMKTVI